MNELICNLHMHTLYSDGSATHAEIVQAALKCDVDVIIVTDHNVWVNGPENYYQNGNRRVLLMIGEEVHDQTRDPQKNHLLVFGAGRDVSTQAYDPQRLIDSVNQSGGISFIAHPNDPPAPAIGETDITWVDWGVSGYTGIELWNGFSEFKTVIKSKLNAIFYAYNPRQIALGPLSETLRKWDELLGQGKRVVAVGGSDAHAIKSHLGPLKKTVFPYEFHFQMVNTHLLTPQALTGDVIEDSRLVIQALRQGHAFIGYDLPAPTRGFRFSAHGKGDVVSMGDDISARNGVTFQIRLPLRAECNLIKNGKTVKTWTNQENCAFIATEPGAYRVEVYLPYLGKRRGWIFSNPIYVRG
jgi:hypothetical protein